MKQYWLEHIRIAAPCDADWDQMSGDNAVRHCDACNRPVYNLSQMRRAEAEQLVLKAEDRLCVRFYRRADGTVLTRDCPVGFAARSNQAVRFGVRAAVLALLFIGTLLLALGSPRRGRGLLQELLYEGLTLVGLSEPSGTQSGVMNSQDVRHVPPGQLYTLVGE